MGGSLLKITLGILWVGSAWAAPANSLLHRLEQGEVLSTKEGSSFVIQTLIQSDPVKVQTAFSDLTQLPLVFDNMAFTNLYKTKNNQNLIYMKLKGLGDGVGVLMEIKSGTPQTFSGTIGLIESANYHFRNQPIDPFQTNDLIKIISDSNQTNPQEVRALALGSVLVLEGPLNEVKQLPSVRAILHLIVGMYSIQKGTREAPRILTYLAAKMSFGKQVPKKNIGDYRGFGDRRLSIAENLGVNLFEALKRTLEIGL